jgi:1-acyl-sn-glycerol-3-phosphate acyltransferase
LAHVSIGTFLRLYCGVRIHTHGAARYPGSALVACNHITGLDPPVVGACLPFEVWWVAKQELFRKAWIGRVLQAYNAFPIQRGTADYVALDRAVALLQTGHNVLMFPEGTRQKQGRLGKPRWGFGYVALRSGRPIVPAFVRGTGDRRPRFRRREPLEIWIGEPFVPPALPDGPESYRKLGEWAMERIAGLMLRSAAITPLGGLDVPGSFAEPLQLEP